MTSEDHLVIVPEKELFHLAFAALIDPARQRFLIEDHSLSYAPSASVYLESLQRSRARTRSKNLSALLIGNPLIDRQLFPSLPGLPGAEAEVRAIAEFYPSGQRTVLSGRQATKAALLAALRSANVVHLSTHALVNETDPERSSILFAAESAEDGAGILLASEIREQQLDKVQLVVLAACQTASGTISVSEGVASLARPFHAAGVPAVIGAWWDVEDRAASRLLQSFHRRFAGLSTEEALRQAQLEQLEGEKGQPNPRLDWAVFGLIGPNDGEKSAGSTEKARKNMLKSFFHMASTFQASMLGGSCNQPFHTTQSFVLTSINSMTRCHRQWGIGRYPHPTAQRPMVWYL